MYTLYYMPGACSMAVHVALNEMGQQVKLENVGGTRPPEFLKINPRGNVPVIADGDLIVREGGAILVYLLDKHKSPLLPASGKERAAALEWLMFGNATLHPAYSKAFGAMGMPAGELKDKTMEAAIERINKLWQDVESRLSTSPFLAGSDATIGDILLTVIANWSANFPAITIGPKAKALFGKIIARPSYQKALADEKVTYKVAA